MLAWDGTYWRQTPSGTNIVKNHTVGGDTYTTNPVFAIKPLTELTTFSTGANKWYFCSSTTMTYRQAIAFCDYSKNLHGVTVGTAIYYNKTTSSDAGVSYPAYATYSAGSTTTNGVNACPSGSVHTWSAGRNGDNNNYWYLNYNGTAAGWTTNYNLAMYAICIYDNTGALKN